MSKWDVLMTKQEQQTYVDNSLRSTDNTLRKYVQQQINKGLLPTPTWETTSTDKARALKALEWVKKKQL